MVPSPKSRSQLRRKAAKRAPKDRILIVCEGKKTEKLYFEDAKQALRIHSGLAQITVEPGEGSNPKT